MSKTTFYVGGNEIVLNHNTNKTDIKRHIAGKVIVTLTDVNASGMAASTDTKYLLRDNLGSVISILDNSGSAEEMSFDPWGQRNSPTDWRVRLGNYPSNPAQFTVTTNRGFTGHEMVDTMGLIHMNGRIYDPRLQRFMQADPFVQSPGDTQSYNRYAYVRNNPLIYTDPSGYFLDLAILSRIDIEISRPIFNVLADSPALATVVQIVGSAVSAVYCGSCAIGFNAQFSKNLAYAQSGSFNAAYRSAAISGVSSAAFYGVGELGLTGVNQVAAHGLVGGITAELQGGKFGHGFISAGLTAGAGELGLTGTAGQGPTVQGVITATVIGGTASAITGGKFANGAVTGAFSYTLNHSLHARKAQRLAQLSKEFKSSLEEARQLGANNDIEGYIDRVRTGGLLDYKNRPEYKNLKGIEDFGNFAFGATGAAWADGYTGGVSNLYPELTTNLLMCGAGAYQEFFQSYKPSDGHFYDLSPPASSNYGDQFRDQINIHTGAQYYFRSR